VLTICRVYIRSGVERISDAEIEAVGSRAYRLVESFSGSLSEIEPTGVNVQVKEGSLIVVGAIVAIASALYRGITAYDDFWSGLERIRRQAGSVASALRQRFQSDPTLSSGPIVSSTVSTGALDKIHRLHEDVTAGRLSPDDAVQETLRAFRSSGEAIDVDMISGVERAFGARRLGSQRLEVQSARPEGERRFMPGHTEEPRARSRSRRLTIKRLPGVSSPTVQFDCG
jgi:hypothetical protein